MAREVSCSLLVLVLTATAVAEELGTPRAMFLEVDGRTQGDWTGRYGRGAYFLQPSRKSECTGGPLAGKFKVSYRRDEPGRGPVFHTTGPAAWDNRVLLSPAYRVRTMAEVNNLTREPYGQGKDLLVTLKIPEGWHVFSTYFLDNDFRQRRCDVRIQDSVGQDLAQHFVEDLGYGKYLRFALLGPGTFVARMNRAECDLVKFCGIFFDPVDMPPAVPENLKAGDHAAVQDALEAYEQVVRNAEGGVLAFLDSRVGLHEVVEATAPVIDEGAKLDSSKLAAWLLWQSAQALADHPTAEAGFRRLVQFASAQERKALVAQARKAGRLRLAAIELAVATDGGQGKGIEEYREMASLYEKLLMTDEAIDTWQQLVTAEPEAEVAAEALDRLADIWRASGMAEQAKAAYARLVRDYPGTEQAKRAARAVTVTVINGKTRAPISEAWVHLRAVGTSGRRSRTQNLRTSAQGVAKFQPVAKGQYRVSISANNFRWSGGSRRITVGDDPVAERFTMEPMAQLVLTMNRADGQPVPDRTWVRMCMTTGTHQHIGSLQTRSGRLSWGGLQEGSRIGFAAVDGLGYADLSQAVLKTGKNEITVVLKQGLTRPVKVTTADGEPVAKASVMVRLPQHVRIGMHIVPDTSPERLRHNCLEAVETQAEGSVLIGRCVPPGVYGLMVHKDGYEPVVIPNVSTQEDAPTLAVKMVAGTLVRGRAFIENGNTPYGNQQLNFGYGTLDRGQHQHSVRTKADGSFILGGLKPGKYDLHFAGQDCFGQQMGMELKRGVPVSIKLMLSRGATVRATVKRSDGKPVQSLKAYLRPVQRVRRVMLRHPHVTVDGNELTCRGVEPGRYQLQVDARLASRWTKNLTVEEGQRAVNVDVVLSVGAGLRCQVVDETGKPVTENIGARLVLPHPNFGDLTLPCSMSARNGTIELTGGPAGAFDLVIQSQAFEEKRVPVRLKSGEMAEARVELKSLPFISGKLSGLTAQDRSSRHGRAVILGSRRPGRSPDRLQFRFTSDGEFRVSGIPRGKCRVLFSLQQTYAIQEIDLTEGRPPKALKVSLEPKLSLGGTVLSAEDGKGVPGVQVHASDTQRLGISTSSAQTDHHGRFELKTLIPTTYDVRLQGAGRVSHRTRRTVEKGKQPQPVEVKLVRGASIAGKLIGFEERRHTNVSLSVRLPGLGQVRANRGASVRPDHTYRLDGLPPGTYVVQAQSHDRGSVVTAERVVTVKPGEDVRDVNLKPLGAK